MVKVGDKLLTKSAPKLKDIYEQELVKKRHNCTDVICLLLFIIFGLVQIALSLVVFLRGGDPRDLLLPHDSSSNTCKGSTPNLFYFNLASCVSVGALAGTCPSPTICVNECPNQNLYYLIESHRSILFNNYCDKNKLKAKYEQIPYSVDSSTYLALATDQICPLYALSSAGFYSRCLPSIISSVLNGVANTLTVTDNITSQNISITDLQSNPISDQTISKAAQYVINLLNLRTFAQYAVEDLLNAAVLIGVLLAIAAVSSFIYIIIMRWIIAPLVYGTLIALIAALSYAIYYCVTKYLALKGNSPTSFTLSSDINYYFSIGYTWLVIACIASLVLLILLLVILVIIKRLRLAIQLICEASKAIADMFITVFFPVIPLLLEIGFFVYFAATAVYIASPGAALYRTVNTNNTNSSNSTSIACNPTVTLSNIDGIACLFYKYGIDADRYIDLILKFFAEYQYVPQIYNLFMFFWTEFFLIGLNQMILAGCFGIWYWSQSKSSCILITSIKDTFIYHLGSIAFGSLLLALVRVVRYLISFVEKRVKKAAGNNSVTRGIIKFVTCCCKCCFYCLEKFLKFLNRNAYIMVAIYGRNFCKSAFDALTLIASNPLRAIVLDSVTTFILFLGSLLITVAMGVLGFFFFAKEFHIDASLSRYFAPNLHYYWLPLVIVIIGSFIIAKTFLYVFEMAVDTVFLCAMKDLSIHDGTPEKPYFMSKKLLRILSVKNVRKVNSVAPVDE